MMLKSSSAWAHTELYTPLSVGSVERSTYRTEARRAAENAMVLQGNGVSDEIAGTGHWDRNSVEDLRQTDGKRKNNDRLQES